MDAKHSRCRNGVLVGAVLSLLWGSPVAAAQPDAWISAKVKMSLLASREVKGLPIDVDTRDGSVALHGAVGTEAERVRAEQLAGEIAGVRAVRNLLQVVPEKAQKALAATDAEIQGQVRNVLERDQALADSAIRVASVTDGMVVLSGRAATPSDHRRALEDARSVSGVRHVASEIESSDPRADEEIHREDPPDAGVASSASDAWITSAAKARLLGVSGAAALDVNLDTRRGIVTLFGKVPSSDAKVAAEREVEQTAGVKAVANELQVVPEPVARIVERNDARLKEAVIDRMAASDELEDAAIGVGVSDGVVRLTGTVYGLDDRTTAVQIAAETNGTRSVVDDLSVEPEPPEVSAGAS
jgi:osmotically-inducible protein OsmY